MSFDLRITFTGMCLFAPDPTGTRMHALLPSFEGAGNDPAHQHHPRLVYDLAYELPDSPHFLRRLACVPLDRMSLSLPQPPGGTPVLTLPNEIADLDTVVGRGSLPRRYLTSDPGPELDCRITMSAGAVTEYKLGEFFLFGVGDPRRMTWQLEWTIRGIPSDRLEWKLQPLGSSDQPPMLEPLYPIGGIIHVKIHNVTCEYLPVRKIVDLPGHKPAEHFEGYYELIKKPSTMVPLHDKVQATEYSDCRCEEQASRASERARSSGEGGDCGCEEGRSGEREAHSHHHRTHEEEDRALLIRPLESGFGGSPVTCVVAKATFEP